jgi:hypothetical protein
MNIFMNYLQTSFVSLFFAALSVGVGCLVKFGLPYLDSLLSEKKLSHIKNLVDAGVKAAEQTIQGSGMGAAKKAFVIDMLQKADVKCDSTVDALVEAAAKEVKPINAVITKTLYSNISKLTGGRVTEATTTEAVVNDPTLQDAAKTVEADANAAVVAAVPQAETAVKEVITDVAKNTNIDIN